MKYFMKLSVISFIYSLILYGHYYIGKYPYKVGEILGGRTPNQIVLYIIVPLIVIVLIGIFQPIITNKWLGRSLHSLWVSILWFPFFIVLYFCIPYVFPSLFPVLDPLSETLEQYFTKGFKTFITLTFITHTLYILALTTLTILMGLKKKRHKLDIV